MPPVPTTSPATGQPVKDYFIHTTAGHFVDNSGRVLLLRGVNLSGADKAPVDRPSYILEGFWESAENGGDSFVGRPLNLDDGSADVHLARLRGWGFNMLRYVFTWEALEHAGPGQYDYEFMDYTVQVLRKCKEYGFRVFMDPHQDLWSRFSGGSGAPYWTLAACGINPRNFTATQAAIIHSEYPLVTSPDPASLPAMIWSTNYSRLASQTLFTLFFAGRDFAPKCIIDGMNIQDYLESHFIKAVGLLADRIRDAGDLLDECVLGWDSLNEPAEGFIGNEDLRVIPEHQPLKKGTCPTPAQSMRLGMGRAQTVENWEFGAFGPRRNGSVTIDPKGRKMWLDPSSEIDGISKWGWRRSPEWKLGTCIWALHDVWNVDTGEVLLPGYFSTRPQEPEKPVDFIPDYWLTHWRNYVTRIRQSHLEAIHFIQPPVFAQPPALEDDDLKGRGCSSAHYYDGLTLMTRHWNWFNADALGVLRGKYSSPLQALKIGEGNIRKSIQQQLGVLQQDTREILGPYPTLIGEIGTPFDMDGRRAYGYGPGGKGKGDYSMQQRALDASLNAADGPNALNWTVWTYCPDSCHPWGDGWNMEDLSLWSSDDMRLGLAGATRYRMANDVLTGNTTAAGSNLSLNDSLPPRPASAPLPQTAISSAMSLMVSAAVPSIREKQNRYGRIPLITTPGKLYDFLTDGARAVKAYSRPWPRAIVGQPKHIQFDIARAEFRLTVVVKAEDAALPSGHSRLDDPEGLPTEIFVPIIHFASQTLLDRQRTESQDDKATLGSSSLTLNDSDMGSDDKGKDSVEVETEADVNGLLKRSGTVRFQRTGVSALNGGMLDLDVHVSDGRWEVDGQILKWWYSVPIPSAGTDKDQAIEHTIVIKRKGGAIKLLEDEEPGFWEQVCGTDSCNLM